MNIEKKATLPSRKEIEDEISQHLSKKYGEQVKIIGIEAQPKADQTDQAAKPLPDPKGFNFNIKPEELAAYLDEFVVRQDEAKAVLSTKICTHFNRIRHSQEHPEQAPRTEGRIKNNVLLIGPTGVGKTFLIKLIARKIGVPFIKGDATKFSETGYVGGDVEDLVRDLAQQAGDDLSLAQYGIIYIDEIDKIAAAPNRFGADVSRTGVQRALLKPMEETEVDLKVSHDPISQLEAIEHFRATGKRQKQVINTKDILFIMSGAFNDLGEIIKKRVQKQTIGFEGAITSKNDVGRYLPLAKAEDLIEFGFESEFVGRLPVLACLDELSVDDLYEILQNFNSSVVVGKKLDFQAYDIRLQFEDAALREIARQAREERTGARGLVSVVEKTLLPFEKKLPSTDIKFLAVTADLVANPVRELDKLLTDHDHRAYHEKHCQELAVIEHGQLVKLIRDTKSAYLQERGVTLTDRRLDLMAAKCQEKVLDIGTICDIIIDLVGRIQNSAACISKKCSIEVRFTEEAVDSILSKQNLTYKTIEDLCSSMTAVFEYGFGLLKHKKGLKQVTIPAKGVEAPEQFINDLVRQEFTE